MPRSKPKQELSHAIQKRIDDLIKTNSIYILFVQVVGPSTIEPYKGKRTLRAIKMRLNRERCCNDHCWVSAWVYSHSTEHTHEYINIETGEYGSGPKP